MFNISRSPMSSSLNSLLLYYTQHHQTNKILTMYSLYTRKQLSMDMRDNRMSIKRQGGRLQLQCYYASNANGNKSGNRNIRENIFNYLEKLLTKYQINTTNNNNNNSNSNNNNSNNNDNTDIISHLNNINIDNSKKTLKLLNKIGKFKGNLNLSYQHNINNLLKILSQNLHAITLSDRLSLLIMLSKNLQYNLINYQLLASVVQEIQQLKFREKIVVGWYALHYQKIHHVHSNDNISNDNVSNNSNNNDNVSSNNVSSNNVSSNNVSSNNVSNNDNNKNNNDKNQQIKQQKQQHKKSQSSLVIKILQNINKQLNNQQQSITINNYNHNRIQYQNNNNNNNKNKNIQGQQQQQYQQSSSSSSKIIINHISQQDLNTLINILLAKCNDKTTATKQQHLQSIKITINKILFPNITKLSIKQLLKILLKIYTNYKVQSNKIIKNNTTKIQYLQLLTNQQWFTLQNQIQKRSKQISQLKNKNFLLNSLSAILYLQGGGGTNHKQRQRQRQRQQQNQFKLKRGCSNQTMYQILERIIKGEEVQAGEFYDNQYNNDINIININGIGDYRNKKILSNRVLQCLLKINIAQPGVRYRYKIHKIYQEYLYQILKDIKQNQYNAKQLILILVGLTNHLKFNSLCKFDRQTKNIILTISQQLWHKSDSILNQGYQQHYEGNQYFIRQLFKLVHIRWLKKQKQFIFSQKNYYRRKNRNNKYGNINNINNRKGQYGDRSSKKLNSQDQNQEYLIYNVPGVILDKINKANQIVIDHENKKQAILISEQKQQQSNTNQYGSDSQSESQP